MNIHPMQDHQRDEVAHLIHSSTNQWYQQNRGHTIFDPDNPLSCRLFTDVYEDLDPGCCLIAESDDGKIIGSCFYHPRETHVSLGIMNAHPEAAGLGVARKLLDEIIRRAGDKPVRLVSSAMNLDSYSLYTKAGFSPRELYQDMQFPLEKTIPAPDSEASQIRNATPADATAMAVLEMSVSGIRRERDYCYFTQNQRKIWRTLITEKDGKITGFLSSITHPASCMLGPGISTNWQDTLTLILAHHHANPDTRPVFLIPANQNKLISTLYNLGARNLELHVSQVLGKSTTPTGIIMPTFMPETG